MPILINDVEVQVEAAGVPERDSASLADLMPLDPGQQELARLLALIDERRARLVVD